MDTLNKQEYTTISLSDSDVIAAMKDIHGYIDITPRDFREVFRIAYHHALQRIQKSVQAKDIMSSPALCIPLNMELIAAARLLADNKFSGAPVVDASGKLLGVLSEKDFLAQIGMQGQTSFLAVIAHCLENKGCMASVLRGKTVQEIMSAPAIAADPKMTAGAISALFVAKQINRLPIVDAESRPIGIVTRSNLIQFPCLGNNER